MTRKEPVKNHVRSGNPSRGQASRAAHTASKGTKRTSTPLTELFLPDVKLKIPG